ncbi:MAG: hypothetical protein DI527_03925 [Chelatococcus sp.]|nr:MAG: hypothetical protein DI527_03925 [Chelatococcus sp.]
MPADHIDEAKSGAAAAIGRHPLRLLGSPLVWLVLFLVAAVLALSLPLRLPLGPNAWDTAVYLDAIQRVRTGQIPGIDFFAPVGPLSYVLAAGLDALFPHAQPMLLVNWALLPVLLPAAAVLVSEIRDRRLALAVLLPFLLFATLPINLHSLYPMPGFDGYGHYNRHVALLLYLLIATLLFVRRRTVAVGLVAVLMLTLFLVKITGAVAGAGLVGYAILARRLKLRDAVLAAALVIGALGLLELVSRVISAYLEDILILLRMNTGALLPRFLTVASVKFNVVAPCALLILTLGFAAWRDGRLSSLAGLRATLASPLGWLVAGLAALAFFETQNTGSLEFIGLWPILLALILQWRHRRDTLRPLVLVLTLACALPSLIIYVERAARAILGTAAHVALNLPALGPLGRVTVKADLASRATGMLDYYADHQDSYRELARRNLSPSHMLASEIDYQALWLMEVQEGVVALKAWEEANGRKLDGVFTLDFADPINRILDRTPTRAVPVGIDPTRSMPDVSPRMLAELARTDAVLMPKCPPTTARQAIAEHFAPALAGRRLVALAPCWDMYLRP